MPAKPIAAAIIAAAWLACATQAMAYGYAEAEDPVMALFRDGVSAAGAGDFTKAAARATESLAIIKNHKHSGAGLAPKISAAAASKNLSAMAELMANIVYLSTKEKLEVNIDSGLKQFNESKTRLMLARKNYLDALDGNIKKNQPAVSGKIMEWFDQALAALGNPGLFGLGRKPADLEKFTQAARNIEAAIEGFYTRFETK